MNLNKNVSVGLALTLAIGIIGFRDTGIFVNSFNAKLKNGTEVSYNPNDRIEIVGEGTSKTTYEVSLDGIRFYVPKASLLKVDNGLNGYKVLDNTPLINENGDIIRLLSLDEYLTHVDDRGELVYVTTADGTNGLVHKTALKEDKVRFITEGIAKEDLTLNNGQTSLKLNKGDSIDVAWFQEDYFVVFDKDQNKYNVPKDKINIFASKVDVQDNVIEQAKKFSQSVEEERVKQLSTNINANSAMADLVVAKGETLIGSPYVWGAVGNGGYDCSGFVTAALSAVNVKLPRTSRDMSVVGEYVNFEDLQKGDLMFFNNGKGGPVNHVALYAGNGIVLHASQTRSRVVADSINSPYMKNNFVNARRVLY